MTGTGQVSMVSNMSAIAIASCSLPSVSSAIAARIQARSAPAQNDGPSPARTTARSSRRPLPGERANAVRSSAIRLGVEGVVDVRPGQRHSGDDACRVPSARRAGCRSTWRSRPHRTAPARPIRPGVSAGPPVLGSRAWKRPRPDRWARGTRTGGRTRPDADSRRSARPVAAPWWRQSIFGALERARHDRGDPGRFAAGADRSDRRTDGRARQPAGSRPARGRVSLRPRSGHPHRRRAQAWRWVSASRWRRSPRR